MKKWFFAVAAVLATVVEAGTATGAIAGSPSIGASDPTASQRVAATNPASSAFVTRTREEASGSRLLLSPDGVVRARLARSSSPDSHWAGQTCSPTGALRSLVDDYLATPNPSFPGFGPTVPGLSVSWSSDDCGTFTYAAGLRDIEGGKGLTPATQMGIASMTKAVVAAVTLKLNETGVFGPAGLDTPVDRLLTPRQIAQVTVGDDPSEPRCPGATYLLNRATLEFEWKAFSCPDFSQVTLRHLMLANHGMYDYLNEVLLPSGASQWQDAVFFELFRLLGLEPLSPPNSASAFEQLKAYGLKRNDDAVIGGNLALRDLEISFGNTGFQLLGVILEQQTGDSLDELIRELIVRPLAIDQMSVYADAAMQRPRPANGYEIFTGEPLIEQTGVYPTVEFNGHTAVNTLSLGSQLPANITTAGGAGGLVANLKSYRSFLDAMVNGDLLGPAAKEEFASSFLPLPDISTSQESWANGFGLANIGFRDIPGLPDFDLLYHPGRLPGILCENGVVRLVELEASPLTVRSASTQIATRTQGRSHSCWSSSARSPQPLATGRRTDELEPEPPSEKRVCQEETRG